jgi:hypothetical protein
MHITEQGKTAIVAVLRQCNKGYESFDSALEQAVSAVKSALSEIGDAGEFLEELRDKEILQIQTRSVGGPIETSPPVYRWRLTEAALAELTVEVTRWEESQLYAMGLGDDERPSYLIRQPGRLLLPLAPIDLTRIAADELGARDQFHGELLKLVNRGAGAGK